MKDRITVSNWCLISSAKLCHSSPSGWCRYSLCAEKQCSCYSFFKVVSVHTFAEFGLLIHTMQTILHLGRKEDKVHCSVYDPSKHIKLCSYGLIRLLCFSENSSRCSFSCNAINVLKSLVIYNWVWKTAFAGLSSGTPEQYMLLLVFLLGARVLLLCKAETTDFMGDALC